MFSPFNRSIKKTENNIVKCILILLGEPYSQKKHEKIDKYFERPRVNLVA